MKSVIQRSIMMVAFLGVGAALLIAPIILKSKSDFSDVIDIVESNDAEEIRLEKLKAYNVNAKLREAGLTPLHYAVMKNDKNGIRLLLKAGADTTVKDDRGHTPVQLALEPDRAAIRTLFETWSK